MSLIKIWTGSLRIPLTASALWGIRIIQPQIKSGKRSKIFFWSDSRNSKTKVNRKFKGSWWLFSWVIGPVHCIIYRWHENICHFEKIWLKNHLQKRYTILGRGSSNLLWSRIGRHQNVPLCCMCNELSFQFTIDTYISIPGCYFSNKLEGNLFTKLLTKSMIIFNFIHHLLVAKYCKALPRYHVVADCDCTSSFHGHGKTKGLKLLEDNLSFQVKVHCSFAK